MALSLPLQALDYVGVAVFAFSGALSAARGRQDPVTFAAFAIVTGVGGGTLRDLLIGAPVFWVHDPGYIYVSLAAAALVWIAGERPWRSHALSWFDAVGLVAYAILGAAKGLNAHVAPAIAVVMGTLTATFGGILRDLLAAQPSVLLRREIYITAAVLAAFLFVIALQFSTPAIAAALAFLCGFGLRAGAIVWGWALPGFSTKEQP